MSETKSEFADIEEIENKIYHILSARFSTDKPWATSSTLSWIMGYEMGHGNVTKEIFAALESLIGKGLVEKALVKNVAIWSSSSPKYIYKALTPHEIAQRKFQQNE